MNSKFATCYYHMDKFAQEICAQCGVCICKECAVKDDNGRIICYQCGNSNLKQEHKEYRKMLKAQGGRFSCGIEFIVPSLVGILIIIGMALGLHYFGDSNMNIMLDLSIERIIANILLAYMLFCIPFGMIMLSDLFAPKYDTLWNRGGWFFLKIVISMFFGWICFNFYLIRFIVNKIRGY